MIRSAGHATGYINLTHRRERFRAVLASDQCIHPALIFDPVSARLAEDLGFPVGALAGSTTSITMLGAPDLVVHTLTECAQQVRQVSRASNLSLQVDCDNGYGNALNVMRTVEELENAGAAALIFEDTELPMRFGSPKGRGRLISFEEAVGKMKAALSARRDPSLAIIAKTRAFSAGDFAEGIRRMKAFETAGVDALFLAGQKTPQEIQAVCAETKLPLLAGQHAARLGDQNFLATNRVRIATPGDHTTLRAAIKAV